MCAAGLQLTEACTYHVTCSFWRQSSPIVSHTSALHTLGLYAVYLAPQLLSVFKNLLASLPASLTQLNLTTHYMYAQIVRLETKTQFFRAVAQVRSLKELHMSQWKAFVGDHAGICCEPLRSIAGLRTVVPTVEQSAACPAGLTFQATK